MKRAHTSPVKCLQLQFRLFKQVYTSEMASEHVVTHDTIIYSHERALFFLRLLFFLQRFVCEQTCKAEKERLREVEN